MKYSIIIVGTGMHACTYTYKLRQSSDYNTQSIHLYTYVHMYIHKYYRLCPEKTTRVLMTV